MLSESINCAGLFSNFLHIYLVIIVLYSFLCPGGATLSSGSACQWYLNEDILDIENMYKA